VPTVTSSIGQCLTFAVLRGFDLGGGTYHPGDGKFDGPALSRIECTILRCSPRLSIRPIKGPIFDFFTAAEFEPSLGLMTILFNCRMSVPASSRKRCIDGTESGRCDLHVVDVANGNRWT
jgi:hypothetical protein